MLIKCPRAGRKVILPTDPMQPFYREPVKDPGFDLAACLEILCLEPSADKTLLLGIGEIITFELEVFK
jgi:hypothetical protein